MGKIGSQAEPGRNQTERVIPLHALAPSGWGEAGRRVRAARLAECPDPDEAAGLVTAYVCGRAPLREIGAGRVGVAPSTLEAYRRETEAWVRWAEGHGVNLLRVTDANLRAYAVALLEHGRRTATVRRAVSVVRTLARAFEWCGLSVQVPTAPALADPVSAWEKRPAPTWSRFQTEAARLVRSALGSRDQVRLRLAASVLLLGSCGLRASEACGLDWSGVDLERAGVRVLGKGAKTRTVPMPAELVQVLAQLEEAQGNDGGPVLRSIRSNRRLHRAGLWRLVTDWQVGSGLARPPGRRSRGEPATGAHVLRHVCGTRAAARLGLDAARDVLGHASAQTTDRTYCKRLSAEALRERVGQALGVLE